jgi:hypothetical protein
METRARQWWIAAIAVLACCNHPGIVKFEVEPSTVCPGKEAVVTWQVDGAARLRAERGPNDWDEQDVPSTGKRRVVPAAKTAFTLTALDANPARGKAYGTKSIELPRLDDERRTHDNNCDETARTCGGVFTLDEHAAGRVIGLRAPRVTRGGKTVDASRICITHDGLAKTCVTPTTPATVDVAAAGTWRVELDLGPDEPTEPPPAFTLTVDFACP